MKNKENTFFIIISLTALIACWFYNIQHISQGGSFYTFITHNFVNPASSSIFMDISLLFLTISIWIFFESKKLEIKYWWFYILSGLFIGISISFPIFLVHRNLKSRRCT